MAAVAFVLLVVGPGGTHTALGATERIRVVMPPGWHEKTPDPSVAQFGENSEFVAYFQLIVESKGDFASSVDLMGYANLAKTRAAKTSKLARRAEAPLASRRVAGRDTVEYEVTGEWEDVRLHYRHIAISCGKESYCQLVCWTLPSHWDEAQAQFDALVKNLP